MLGDVPMPMRPSPWSPVGSPRPISRHVVPPSTDLNRPLFGPEKAPFSHGPWRASHSTAYTVCGFEGSKATSAAPVFSSLYKTLSKVLPPSRDLNTPRSVLGPYG